MFEATANDDHRVGRAKAAPNDDHSLVWALDGRGSGASRMGVSPVARNRFIYSIISEGKTKISHLPLLLFFEIHGLANAIKLGDGSRL